MADLSVIPPAPLDPASLRASQLCSEGAEEAGCPVHMSGSGERQDLCFQEGK